MAVQRTLERALEAAEIDAGARDEARAWLARTEVLLDWIARHPKLVEINSEAAHLLGRYRGGAVH
jgi:hypothetical protein